MVTIVMFAVIIVQLSVDVAWSPACIDERCYDYVALANIADFIFIMSYDQRSQISGPCVAWANSAFNLTLSGTYFMLSTEAVCDIIICEDLNRKFTFFAAGNIR